MRRKSIDEQLRISSLWNPKEWRHFEGIDGGVTSRHHLSVETGNPTCDIGQELVERWWSGPGVDGSTGGGVITRCKDEYRGQKKTY